MAKFNVSSLKWSAPPSAGSVIGGDRVVIAAQPRTDLWQRTYYGFSHDDAAMAVMTSGQQRFSFSVRVDTDAHGRFDHAGIIIYQDSDNWFKVGAELENSEYQRLGSVLTNNGYSDWATTDIDPHIRRLYFRLSRRESDFLIESSYDGVEYRQMRIFHLWSGAADVNFGVFACSPLDGGFTAEFSEFELGECVWGDHVE